MQKQSSRSSSSMHTPKGRTFLVFFSGLVLGLAIALVIAFYITRAPTPTLTKSVQPTEPSAPSRNTTIQSLGAEDSTLVENPNDALHNQPADNSPAAPESIEELASRETPKPSRTPKPNALASDSTQPASYILQVAAYTTAEEAERQKAKLAMQGYATVISPYETNNVKYYRLRIGPFSRLDDAEKTKAKLAQAKIDALLIKTTN